MNYRVTPTFIDIFKIGDNINYNIEILNVLYSNYNSNPKENALLIKPIVIINTSIIEAILYDFIINRIQKGNKNEQILTDLKELRQVKISKLNHFIVQSKKYDLFNASQTKFYNDLNELASARNRAHIQNEHNDKPRDEKDLFTPGLKILSEQTIEIICSTLVNNHPRTNKYHGFVSDFIFPWNTHLPKLERVEKALKLSEVKKHGKVGDTILLAGVVLKITVGPCNSKEIIISDRYSSIKIYITKSSEYLSKEDIIVGEYIATICNISRIKDGALIIFAAKYKKIDN